MIQHSINYYTMIINEIYLGIKKTAKVFIVLVPFYHFCSFLKGLSFGGGRMLNFIHWFEVFPFTIKNSIDEFSLVIFNILFASAMLTIGMAIYKKVKRHFRKT